ncbi:class I SAM-dependent methyltransferase [Pontibacter sp. G13]|uniref:class I SAM-dependent methyltransferase n=1 Tax=Pontibacter sp. G13 TaxID=3074898 RepID=UPI00288A44F3|nr:class I SAM-dependent methyltransferase [Pontibacter sp. G13]WNJ19376.1 class I SAM-dependent methyltransferase [Pontibacter sp. G13]
MEEQFSAEELQELERQLSCPSGEFGIEVAERMNETNIGMTLSTMDYLDIGNHQSVLELGHGNCAHLPQLLGLAEGVSYAGLEISETMFEAAKTINHSFSADFRLYDGVSIPHEDEAFDRLMSVNSIYFWEQPDVLMKEIERVLKPGGLCVLTYAEKDFMKDLPFVGTKFKLFGAEEIKQLVASCDLVIQGFESGQDQMEDKLGVTGNRSYSMVKLRKT